MVPENVTNNFLKVPNTLYTTPEVYTRVCFSVALSPMNGGIVILVLCPSQSATRVKSNLSASTQTVKQQSFTVNLCLDCH